MDTGTMAIFMVLVSILCMCLTIGIGMIVYQVAHLKGYYNNNNFIYERKMATIIRYIMEKIF